MNAHFTPPSDASTLSHIDLQAACEKLAAIAVEPPEDRNEGYEEFPFGGLSLCDHQDGPAHRCLSAPEAKVKLVAIQRLTGRSLGHFLDQWEQLPAATLLTLQSVVLSMDARERQQGTVGQAEDWLRLDELLFRRWFTAWVNQGTNFVPAPRQSVAARQIGVGLPAYKAALARLRDERVRPTHKGCPARLDLWLGDPPRDEAGAHAPRLWVSARAHRWPAAAAAQHGLLPANTPARAQAARAAILRRWLDEDDLDDLPADELPHQFTQCRRCGKWLGIDGAPGVRREA